jgi:hypothetical protein
MVGEISLDAEHAAIELARRGCNVDVITYHETMLGVEKRKEGFRVHRVTNPVQTHSNIVTWALTLNTELQRVAANIALESEDDLTVVHAIEWLCVPAAIQLKKTLAIPYLLSIYSLEHQRSVGGTSHSGPISYLEREGSQQADKVIVYRKVVAESVNTLYGIGSEKLVAFDKENRNWTDELMQQYAEVITRAKNEPKNR